MNARLCREKIGAFNFFPLALIKMMAIKKAALRMSARLLASDFEISLWGSKGLRVAQLGF